MEAPVRPRGPKTATPVTTRSSQATVRTRATSTAINPALRNRGPTRGRPVGAGVDESPSCRCDWHLLRLETLVSARHRDQRRLDLKEGVFTLDDPREIARSS